MLVEDVKNELGPALACVAEVQGLPLFLVILQVSFFFWLTDLNADS
jgi:hypothetical protein